MTPLLLDDFWVETPMKPYFEKYDVNASTEEKMEFLKSINDVPYNDLSKSNNGSEFKIKNNILYYRLKLVSGHIIKEHVADLFFPILKICNCIGGSKRKFMCVKYYRYFDNNSEQTKCYEEAFSEISDLLSLYQMAKIVKGYSPIKLFFKFNYSPICHIIDIPKWLQIKLHKKECIIITAKI